MSQTVKRGLLLFLLLGMLFHLVGCAGQREQDETALTTARTATPNISQKIAQTPVANSADSPVISELATLIQVAPSRTPQPTATPDALSMAADEVAQQTGLAGTTILGAKR